MRKSHRVALLPPMALLILVCLFFYLYGEVNVGLGVDHQTLTRQQANVERLRLIWGASAFGVAAALAWNLVVAVLVLHTILSREDRLTCLLFLLLTPLLAVVAIVFVRHIELGGPMVTQMLAAIFCQAGVDASRLTREGNVFASGVVVLMLASLSALAIPRRAHSPLHLAQLIRLWLLSLYGAAVLLAFAVFEVWSLYRWGATVAPVAAQQPAADVADGAALAAAILFVVLLATMYLPIAALHTRWLAVVISGEVTRTPELDVEKWLARFGIKSSPVSVGTAVILPAIAFALTALTKQVIEHAR